MYNVHSVDALKAHLVDTTSAGWHQLHQDVKATYSREFTQLKEAVRDGAMYTLSHRLTYYSSTFASTTPVNREVTVGFYDTPAAEITTVFVFPVFGSEVRLLNNIIQTTADASHQSSGSKAVGRAEVDVQRTRVRRSSSTRSLSTNAGASTSRKRGRSPLQEDRENTSTSKRPRLAELSEEQTSHEDGGGDAHASVSYEVSLSTRCELAPLSRGVGCRQPTVRERLTAPPPSLRALRCGSTKSPVESYAGYPPIVSHWAFADKSHRVINSRVLSTAPWHTLIPIPIWR